jgi:hypothetical protein
VLGGKWPLFVENGVLNEEGRKFIIDLKELRAIGKEVVLLSNPPTYKFFSTLRATLKNNDELKIHRSNLEDYKNLNSLKAIGLAAGVNVIDTVEYICPNNFCEIVSNGMPLFSDATHITATHAIKRARFIDKILTVENYNF